jgi:selenocysteine lyase/cysteine desulfurase
VGYASNALGTINPVKKISQMARDAGALVYIDAVQYAPHGPIDVQALECDFLVSSAYKFYGPHVGVLYGRYERLEAMQAYKVRPASNHPPGKWETGTGNFEGIAGVLGAIEHLEWVGDTFTAGDAARSRREKLVAGMGSIQQYEIGISRGLVEGLMSIPGIRVYGITDPERFDERVPTVSFTMADRHPDEVAAKLGEAGIFVWSGNYYAVSVTERLGLEDKGGMVRVGGAHYNSQDEINVFLDSVDKLR